MKKERENLEQEARLLEFLTSHKPKYVPIADSVCFQWIQRQSYGKHSYFLGRWQKDKYFCFGRVVYDDNSNWAEALLELEKEMNSGNVDVPFEIIDHEGNAVRWEDFLYHALVSCGNYDPQADVERLSPCLFGQMHRYSYAGGINP
ncbi:hypothetical protein ACFOQM_23385 [Paenibacillus sp. GCM10012307]|uniref:Uncharacterized protein n=1 Tax=Paenibacillus roseus TaxID=2798579 RepID=A0A934JCA2_9BACL|nr:hypothetical protein [Paenibacillus roseus]MBJ6364168.1 hypothetical protein [Paenibacillus roseus]